MQLRGAQFSSVQQNRGFDRRVDSSYRVGVGDASGGDLWPVTVAPADSTEFRAIQAVLDSALDLRPAALLALSQLRELQCFSVCLVKQHHYSRAQRL